MQYQVLKILKNLCRLSESQCEYGALVVASRQRKGAVVQSHDLSRKAQAYAGAFLLGGEERNEDFFLAFLADRGAVVEDIYYDVF